MIEKELLKTFLDEIEWSFSNIKCFETCKKNWYRRYILGDEGCGNFYADYGTLAHEMLEQLASKKIDLFDMKRYVEYNWNRVVVNEAPSQFGENDLVEIYYNQLLEFCESFDGFEDETVGTEIKFNTTIKTEHGDKPFVGFIDRLSKENNDYIITDYKSKSKFNGKKELKEYSVQLYLYSKYVYEQYGKFPKRLKFFLFRSGEEVIIEFNKKDYDEAIHKIGSVIDKIYNESDFECNYSYFFCRNLCEYRYDCTFS